MFKRDQSFIVLYTKDVDATNNFYTALGGEIKEKADDKVVVGFGGFDLHFILASSEQVAEYKYIADAEHYGAGVIFYIETDDIAAAYAAVATAGGATKSEIYDNHWGSKEFLFEDNNGFKFAVYQ